MLDSETGGVAQEEYCEGALRVFAAAASAMRRLEDAGALCLEVDLVDVASYPRRECLRMLRACGAAPQGDAAPLAATFDRCAVCMMTCLRLRHV